MKHHVLLAAAALLGATAFVSCSKQSSADVLPANELAVTQSGTALQAAATVYLNNWMSAIDDSRNLSSLSIPGTHDSGARFEPIGGTAKCQNLTIADQLNNGIRFLDIRCRHIDDAFAIHHGSIYQNMNFDDVLTACKTFMQAHPTEAIIMSVKEEYNASNTTRSFEATFDSYVARYPGLFSLTATMPTLGDARGKIVLLRRFSATGTPKGIDAINWADNTTFTISNAVTARVQDNYVVPDNNAKWTNITNLLTEAKNGAASTLYINFCSGYKSLIFGIPSITTVSNAINPQVVTYFTANTQGRYGMVLCDFADSTKATLIKNTNF